ncbi:cystatin-like [Erythrolamprus reginae]|uniref:cystatin-like n=1 Tax=Erythrolamprus reginae TaxID=121349 RepID=UPI00396CC46E
MVHSRLPAASLLGLFAALLMLPPEPLLGNPEGLSDLTITDEGTRTALAFAMESYNKDRTDSGNYFKVLRLGKKVTGLDYRFLVELAETRCKKKPGLKIIYGNVQKCNLLPGKPKRPICYMHVYRELILFRLRLHMKITVCFLSVSSS